MHDAAYGTVSHVGFLATELIHVIKRPGQIVFVHSNSFQSRQKCIQFHGYICSPVWLMNSGKNSAVDDLARRQIQTERNF